ncbi:MAG: RidA family protein [Candidatus Omnitrophica bacterium]|nr:RidA family protein [Candidatus Omnitrophota bacterium]MCB9747515.1 RidA family protein [Candidatus Omnitrophota bacterium]
MNKTIIFSSDAPKPVGPYNQAVKTGNLVFLAGQIPIDPTVGKITATDVAAQTHQIIKNIQAVLTKAGTSLDKVIKTTVFMKDLKDFSQMNEVYAQYFKAETAPARSTIQVAALPLDSLVEIEVVAEI